MQDWPEGLIYYGDAEGRHHVNRKLFVAQTYVLFPVVTLLNKNKLN